MNTTSTTTSVNAVGEATGETTSLYTLEPDPYSDLPDVSHRNISVMLAIATLILKLSPDSARTKLFHRLPKEWKGKMETNWAPLWVYRLVERNLARLLGNPAGLLNAAMFGAPRDQFGEKSLWVFNLLRLIASFILPLVTTPAFYFQRILPAVSRLFNRNKVTEPLQADWCHTLVRYTRAEFAGKRLRNPQRDVFSMLWWAPGFTAGVVTFWQKSGIQIIHHLVELDPADVFSACAEFISGQGRFEALEHCLLFNNQRIANRVHLRRDDHGYYTDPDSSNSTLGDYKVGWLITDDLEVTAPNGQTWTILHAGEIYCAEAGCSITEYNYTPVGRFNYGLRALLAHLLPPLASPVLWLLAKAVGACVNYLDRRAIEAWERAEVDELRLMVRRLGRELFADEEEVNQALRGEKSRRELNNVVIVRLDFEGHTALRRKLGERQLSEMLRPFWLAVFDFDVNPQVSKGLLPKRLKFGDVVVRFITFLGDGAYIAIYNAPLMVLVQVAIQFASYLHDQAEQLELNGDLPLRVSITHGDIVLTAFGRRINPEDPFDDRRALVRQFAEGGALDAGSRYDEVAKTLRRQAKATGQNANRFTLISTELFAHGEHHGVVVERLGVQSVRDVGDVDLLRVLDEKAHRVGWPKK